MDVNGTVERLFAPARRPGRVGAEVELIPVTDTARPRPVDPAVLATGFDAGFVRAVAPSFEAGGQLELSPAPRPTTAALIRDLDRMLRRAAAIASARGIRLEATGQRARTEAATGFSPETGALLSIARTARQADAPVSVSGGVS